MSYSLEDQEIKFFDGLDPQSIYDVPDLVSFPVGEMPAALGSFIRETARETQTPDDFTGMLCLATLGAAASFVGYRVKLSETWTQPLNLYCCVIAPPAERKSAVVKKTTKPLMDYEKHIKATAQVRADEVSGRIAGLITHAEALERRAKATGNAPGQDRPLTREERIALMEEAEESRRDAQDLYVYVPRIVAEDATPEALALIMAEHKGKMAIISDEGNVFFSQIMGRYSQNSNLELVLKAHDGETPFIRDRVDKKMVRIESPCLDLGLMVQPQVIMDLAADRGNGTSAAAEMSGRGMLARFMFGWPIETLMGHRQINAKAANPEVVVAYENIVRQICHSENTEIELSRPAKELFTLFCEETERCLAPGIGCYADIREWAGKMNGAVGRIAALLQLAENPASSSISEQNMARAISMVPYLVANARRVLGMITTPQEIRVASQIWEWLNEVYQDDAFMNEKVVKKGDRGNRWTIREIQRGALGGRGSKEVTLEGLQLLEDRGWVKVWHDVTVKGVERKGSICVSVHPQFWSSSSSSVSKENGSVSKQNGKAADTWADFADNGADTVKTVVAPF